MFGTGSFITPDTLITNEHVIQDLKDIENKVVIEIDGNPMHLEIKDLIFPKDQYMAIGIVKLEEPITNNKKLSHIKILKIADKENIEKTRVNDFVKVIGYLGYKTFGTLWISSGNIKELDKKFMSFNALISGGSSGSPIFNDNDEFIGLMNASNDNINKPLSFGSLIYDEARKFI